MSPRSYRNNNPGNLDRGQPWQGLMPVNLLTIDQKDEPRFAVFQAPQWGFRAMAVLLKNYFKLYRADTVREIISRWAPPTENNTEAYIAAVAHALDVKDTDQLRPDGKTLFTLIKAITRHETGSWEPYWHDADLAQGLELAGVAAHVA